MKSGAAYTAAMVERWQRNAVAGALVRAGLTDLMIESAKLPKPPRYNRIGPGEKTVKRSKNKYAGKP